MKITAHSHTRPVKVVTMLSRTVTTDVTLTLSTKEAYFLQAVMRFVGGDPIHTDRSIADEIGVSIESILPFRDSPYAMTIQHGFALNPKLILRSAAHQPLSSPLIGITCLGIASEPENTK